MAGLKEIPVKVLTDVVDLRLRQVSENVHRTEMNHLDLAQEMATKKAEENLSWDELSKYYSLAAETIQGYIRLLGMPDIVTKAVVEGKMSSAQALAIASIKNEVHLGMLVEKIKSGKLSHKRSVQLAGIYLSRGGEAKTLSDFLDKKPSPTEFQRMIDELGIGYKIRVNLRSGGKIIRLATELALALEHIRGKGLPPFQIPRVALALTALESESNSWMKKQDKKLLKAA